MKIFQPVSLWALLAGIALYLAQLPPIPGVILMMFGAPLVAGLLFHVALIALFVEALTGRVPRWLVLVPLAAYGSYYAVWFQEGRDLVVRKAQVEAATPKTPFVFDPAHYSIADDTGADFTERYAVPSVYTHQTSWPYAWSVHLLAPQCDFKGNHAVGVMTQDMRANQVDGCRISFHKTPPHPVVRLVHHPVDSGSRRDQVDITDVTIDDVVRLRYSALVTSRLPSVPLFIAGCFLIDSVSQWRCMFDFDRKRVVFGAYPGSIGGDQRRGALIGLHEYTADELHHYAGYAENLPLIDTARQAVISNTPIPYAAPPDPLAIARAKCGSGTLDFNMVCHPPERAMSCGELAAAINDAEKEVSALTMEASYTGSTGKVKTLSAQRSETVDRFYKYQWKRQAQKCPAPSPPAFAYAYTEAALRCLNYRGRGNGGRAVKADCDRANWARNRY